MSSSRALWLLIAGVALVSALGLSRMSLGIDLHIVIVPLMFTGGLVALGSALAWIGERTRSMPFVCTGGADFFGSAGQFLTFLTFAGGLQYVASATNLPLADAAMLRADAALGFDWDTMSAWIDQHGLVREVLRYAYASIPVQLAVLFVANCMRAPGKGNAELIWCFALGLLIVTAIAVPFPALGHAGMIGQRHIDTLIAARAGVVDQLDGIITFPSFHTVLGVLFIYSARRIRVLFALAVPLNVALIAATPACGGHYLVDVIAGLAVAGLTVGLVRRILAPRPVYVMLPQLRLAS